MLASAQHALTRRPLQHHREAAMDNERLTRYWMIAAGISLVGAGLIGFLSGNPMGATTPEPCSA